MLHVGAAGVFMLQSFGSIRLTALTHRDAMFPSVQPPLFLFFNPAWTPVSPLHRCEVRHQAFVNAGYVYVCLCVALCVLVSKMQDFKSQLLFKSQIQYEPGSWLVKVKCCPWTPQWGVYYSNYQRNVLLISHIYLFFHVLTETLTQTYITKGRQTNKMHGHFYVWQRHLEQ